ncbi:MAG: NAD(P)H-hydrate dehydratase, partial [Jannaschia sp.]
LVPEVGKALGWDVAPARLTEMPRVSVQKGWMGPERHKYDHGHVLVLAGGLGRTGAARLAARGALRIGAGLVTVGAPAAALLECAAQLTAIMLRRCDDAAALDALLNDKRINVLCLGPGLGTDTRAVDLVYRALSSGRSTVLDADALTLIGREPGLIAALHSDCVLTPHGGEFARLFPDIADQLAQRAMAGPAYSKVDATRDAAARAGCTVLFKGPDTVIADPTGRASINAAVHDRAAPWLATAGAGDVLAGIIAGLLARGFSAHEAAASAAWVQVEAARHFGPGLIAEDLPDQIPAVLRSLSG